MLFYPNAKINIGLNVIRSRDDGFHDIEAGFFPVDWRDIVEFVPSKFFSLHTTGVAFSGGIESHTVYRAYQAIQELCPMVPNLDIHVHKNVPAAAGLGGGSSDAAFMLRVLNEEYLCDLNNDQLHSMARALGSDCPFFLLNRPAVGKGRGEKLEALETDLSGYQVLLVNPGIAVRTADAYANVPHSHHEWHLKKILQSNPEEWRDKLANAFEEYVFWKHPEVGALKGKMYRKGAVFAAMSGSGSTVYGLFREGETPAFEEFKDYPYVKRCRIIS